MNVCIYRIPRKEDIVLERSHCMSCGNVLKWYELIPVISFLIQGGKCRSCKTKLSMQYPLIELANGLIYIWIFAVKGFGLESVLFCACASTLIVISMIDFRTYEIPFGCNLVILALGAVRLILDLPHWYDYVIGFFTVSGIFMIIYWITRGNGIGGGDIKLAGATGLVLGLPASLTASCLGLTGFVMYGCMVCLWNRFKGKRDKEAFPVGPFLAGGAAAVYCMRLGGWMI